MNGTSSADASHDIAPRSSSFGDLLRHFRLAAEFTQEELAERSGVSVRAISDLERSVKTRPQRATVKLLADGLSLSGADRAAFEESVPARHRGGGRAHSLDLPVGGFLGSVPNGAIVARGLEIERIRAVVNAAVSGSGRLLLLTGEPGVGKTRLAQEATLICRASGMYLAAGQCFEPQRGVPYFPYIEILTRLVPVVRSRLGFDPVQRWPSLRPLIPIESIGSSMPGSPGAGERDKQRLFWSVSELIETLALSMPVVIAVDDLHWADLSSLELLFHLAHQLRTAPVLLLGTYRDTDVGPRHPLRRVLRDLHRAHLSDEITVGRLDLEGTKALIAATLDDTSISASLVDLVQRQTEGNSFFVQEIVRMLVERGGAIVRRGVWEYIGDMEVAIPMNVQEAIGERLSRLSTEAQAVLSEASVLGERFAFDDLLEMGDATEEQLEVCLDEAVEAHVVRFGDADRYAFSHALIQRHLYRQLTPRRRRRLHLAAGAAIEKEPESQRVARAAELARHFQRAGDRVRALPHTVLAADQAEERFAHREAIRLYRLALESLDEREGIAARALIVERLGWVLTNYGRYAEARQEVEQSRSLYREVGDLAGEVRTTVQLGSIYRAIGSPDTAIDRVRALLDRLDSEVDPREVTELNIVLETLCYSTGRFEEGLRAAEHAVQLARRTGDYVALSRAETGQGSQLVMLSRLVEGIDVLEEAITIPGAEKDPYNFSRALENLSQAQLLRGNMRRSLELTERSLSVAERIQSPWDTAMAQYSAGSALRQSGDWERARIYLEQCDALRRSLAPRGGRSTALSNLRRCVLMMANGIAQRSSSLKRLISLNKVIISRVCVRQPDCRRDSICGEDGPKPRPCGWNRCSIDLVSWSFRLPSSCRSLPAHMKPQAKLRARSKQ